jgi:hypothetical protein
MTPNKTECNAETLSFGQLDGRNVVVNFQGGHITQDAGLLLIAQLDQRYRISERSCGPSPSGRC